MAAALRARAGSDGLIRAVDAVADSPLAVTSAGSALALLSPGLGDKQSPPRARAVLRRRRSPPATACARSTATHPERSARNYWRGPVWANVTWLTALGLDLHGEARAARALREQMLQRRSRAAAMREYFVARVGPRAGARDFAWTAALCLRDAVRRT